MPLHPRVDEAIGEVGQQVHQDDGEGVDDHHALQHRVVALVERADDQLAQARPVEDDLGQHRVADQDAEIEPDDRDHGNEAVAEGVAPDDGARRHALGARRADVILAEHLEHRRARHPRDIGGHDDGEIDGGEREVAQSLDRIVERPGADHREPAQLDGKDEEQQDRRDEAGKRKAEQRADAGDIVDPGVAAQRRPDAERDADERAEHDRRHRQVDRVGQDVAHLFDDRLAGHQRVAPFAAHGVDEEVDVLRADRLVDAQAVAHVGERLRARLIAEDRLRRIARQHARQHEDDGEHREQRRYRKEQALEDVAEHGTLPARRPLSPWGEGGSTSITA